MVLKSTITRKHQPEIMNCLLPTWSFLMHSYFAVQYKLALRCLYSLAVEKTTSPLYFCHVLELLILVGF